jgi:3-oxoacyl-[acyl-carrier protein] reductase
VRPRFGCRGFSLCASKDLDPLGVCVTCVLPDAVQTPMADLQLDFDEASMAFSGGDLLTASSAVLRVSSRK